MNRLNTERLESAIKYISGWLDFNYRDSRLPGIVVAIQHEDKLLLNNAHGYANQTEKIPMKSDHVFRVASQSKTFTATAIMQLYEAGKLRLDDKISEHLDWFTSDLDEEVENITIRHFLNHTSGLLRDDIDADYWQFDDEFPSRDELKNLVQNSKLRTLKTNQHFKYSNYAYSLLGQLIEAVSGLSYEEYMNESIISKLELTNTYPELSPKANSELADGHTAILFNNDRKIVSHKNTNGMSAATGFCSTASDLCRYFMAHCYGNDTLINDSSKREMQHGYWSPEDDGEAYGLGLVEYRNRNGNLYGHGGGFPGFITNTRFRPTDKLVVSVMTNSWDGPASYIAKSIINIIDYFQNNEGNIEDATAFEGRFYGRWHLLDIINVNDKLIASSPRYWNDFENDAQEFTRINKNTLEAEKKSSYGSPGEELIYDFDDNGATRSVRFAGMKLLLEKDYLQS